MKDKQNTDELKNLIPSEDYLRNPLILGLVKNLVTYMVYPSRDEAVLLSSYRIDDPLLGVTVSYEECFGEYIRNCVHEIDRENFKKAVNPSEMMKRLTRDGEDFIYSYRDISTGEPLWYSLRVIRLSEDELLYGYLECERKVIHGQVYDSVTKDYIAIALADLETNTLKIIKKSPFFETTDEGKSVPYEWSIRQYAGVLEGEGKELFERLSDPCYVIEELKNDDRKTYSYFSKGLCGGRWVSCTLSALRRNVDGDVTSLLLAFGLANSFEIENQELTKTVHLHKEIFDVVSSAFLLLNYINLNEDSFVIVKPIKDSELYNKVVVDGDSYSECIANWINEIVHPDDREKIRSIVSIENLREKFKTGNSIEEVIRARYSDGYHYVEVCFARTESYDETSEIVLYCIDKNNETLERLRKNEEVEIIVAERTAALKDANKSLNLLSDRMLEFVGDLVESRNEESGKHIKRVKGYTQILATKVMEKLPEYGLTEADIEMMAHASALHDIGKIAIPDSVLLKPGRLTAEEFECMKTHSAHGAEIVEKMEDIWDNAYISMAKDICLYHHEKWDGKGYPRGLKGDEIPISAQIVSLADIYDALTNDRCYKKAFSPEKACEMINGGECGAFSEKILDCFNDVRGEFEQYLQSPEEVTGKDTFSVADDTDYRVPEYVKSREFLSGTIPLLMRLSENMPGGFYLYYCQGDGELIFFNDLLVSIFGCENHEEFIELTGNTFKGMVLPEDYDETKRTVDYLIEHADNLTGHVVHRIKRKDGKIRKVDEYGHLIHTDDYGDVVFVFTIDVTEYNYGKNNAEEMENPDQVFSGLHILIVDDDDMNRDIAEEILVSEGAVVTKARDGAEALKIINDSDVFDMILMDVFMPVMNGIDAVKEIRKLPVRNNMEVPIIAFSTDMDSKLKKQCLDAGVDECIRKPLNLSELSMKFIACMKMRTRQMQGKVRESLLLANTDALTKVKNATAYAERMGDLNCELLNGQSVEFAIVMCDINDLKLENDKFGHDSGDLYIKNCCRIISKSFKHSPVYRIGGDEFVVIVQGEDFTNRELIFVDMMENVAISSKYPTAEKGRASFAAGMAVFDPETDRTVSDTVKRADEAMYSSKMTMKD